MTLPRDNPFRTERFERLRYRFAATSWCDVLARLDARGGRGAIVGPHGSGKTTLLHELAARLGGARSLRVRHARLNGANRRLPSGFLRGLTNGDAVLIDGAERLPAATWPAVRWRARRAGVLVLTQHGPGRLPTLIETSVSPALLADLGRQLAGAEFAALCDDPAATLARHDGNLRNVWLELFDRCAAVAGPPVRGQGLAVEYASEPAR